MRAALVVLFLLALTTFYFAQTGTCPTCNALNNSPQAQITLVVNNNAQTLDATLYYMNLTDGTRPLIGNAVLLLEAFPGKQQPQLYVLVTNSAGRATFDFSSIYIVGGRAVTTMASQCTNFKIIYCPFCVPVTPTSTCGFSACLDYARISSDKTSYSNMHGAGTINSINDIPYAPPSAFPAFPNPKTYLPQAQLASYCPPPQAQNSTPAFCLPLIIVFSLLSGALYVTGRNPFAGFNMGGARIGRHIRYQARGRGVSVSTQAIAAATQSVSGAVKTVKSQGMKGLAKQEKAAATARTFGIGGIKQAIAGVSAYRSAKTAVAQAKVDAMKAGPTQPMTFKERQGIINRGMEAALGGGVAKAPKSGEQTAKAGGFSFTPTTPGAAPRGSELMFVSKNLGAKGWAGVGGYFATLGGTLGKVAGFMLLNSQPVQFIEAFRYAFKPADQYKSFSEMAFVNQGKRRDNDAQALKQMTPDGGIAIRLPKGWAATLQQKDILKDEKGKVIGYKIMLLADKKLEYTSDGMLTITMDKKGTLTYASCITKDGTTLAFGVREKGGPAVLVSSPETLNPKSFVIEVNKNSTSYGTKAEFESKIGPVFPAGEKRTWDEIAAPLTRALGAAGGLALPTVLGSTWRGNALIRECDRSVAAVASINASLGMALNAVIRETEKSILSGYTEEKAKKLLDTEHDRLATIAFGTVLARDAGANELTGLKASPLSDPAKLGATIADDAGFNKGHGFTLQQSSDISSAISTVITNTLSTKGAEGVAALAADPSMLGKLLAAQLPPATMNLLHESALSSIAGSMGDAVHANTQAPIIALNNAVRHSEFVNLVEFGEKSTEKRSTLSTIFHFGAGTGRFTEAQSQEISGFLAQGLGGLTLPQLQAKGKPVETAIKAAAADALTDQLQKRLMAVGVDRIEAGKAATFTIQQVTSLDLSKDPHAGGRTPTGEVAKVELIITNQLLSCGLSKREATKEAESMVRGLSDPGIQKVTTAVGDAAQHLSTNLAKEGFTPAVLKDLNNVTFGQIKAAADVRADIVPTTQTEKAQQFAEMLARDRNNPDIPPQVKNLLEQREFNLNAEQQSALLGQVYAKGGQLNLPGISERASSLTTECSKTYVSQVTKVLDDDKTFKKLDTPEPVTGRTIREDMAAANAQSADASRLDRLMGRAMSSEPVDIQVPEKDEKGNTVLIKVPKRDEQGNPVLDGKGNPVLVETSAFVKERVGWSPTLGHDEKAALLEAVEASKRQSLDNAIKTGDLPTAQAICAERVNFYKEIDPATAKVYQDALASIGGVKHAPPQDVTRLGKQTADNLFTALPPTYVPGATALELVEAKRGSASYFGDNAMVRASEVLTGNQGSETQAYAAAYADSLAKMHAISAGKDAFVAEFGNGLKTIARTEGRPEADVNPAATREIVEDANKRVGVVVPTILKSYDEQISAANDAKNPAAAGDLLSQKNAALAFVNSEEGKKAMERDVYSQVVMEHLNIPQTPENVEKVRKSVEEAVNSSKASFDEARNSTYAKLKEDYEKREGVQLSSGTPPGRQAGGGGGQEPPPETPPSKPSEPPSVAARAEETAPPAQPEKPQPAPAEPVSGVRKFEADVQNPDSQLNIAARAAAEKDIGSELHRLDTEYGAKIRHAKNKDEVAELEREKTREVINVQTQRKDFELDHLVKSVMEQSDVKDINTVKESIREMRSPGGEPSKPRDEASWQPEPSKVPGRKGESVSSSGGTGSSIKSQEQVEAEYNLEKKKKAAGKGGTEKG